MKSPVDRRFKGNDRIVKFLAVGAEDGLDNRMPAAIRATRHPRAVTAFGTFEEIRAAHKPFAELRPACSALRDSARQPRKLSGLVGWQGLEPWTNALKGHCSTN